MDTPGLRTRFSLEETFELKNKWLPGHPDQTSIGTYLLAEWISDPLLPYTTVENERFNVFMNNIYHKFDAPSEKVFRQIIIPNIYRCVQYKIMELLQNNLGDSCTATTDIWLQRVNTRILASHCTSSIKEESLRELCCVVFHMMCYKPPNQLPRGYTWSFLIGYWKKNST